MLRGESFGGEVLVRGIRSVDADRLHPRRQLREAPPARRAAFEVRMLLAHPARPGVSPEFDEPGIVQVCSELQSIKNGHGVSPPSLPLDLPRAARAIYGSLEKG